MSEWCFVPLSKLFQPYHGSRSNIHGGGVAGRHFFFLTSLNSQPDEKRLDCPNSKLFQNYKELNIGKMTEFNFKMVEKADYKHFLLLRIIFKSLISESTKI